MNKIEHLRREVENIQRAQERGCMWFKEYQANTGNKIKRTRYQGIHPVGDIMAVIDGKMCITLENLQYIPAKVYYIECK